MIKPRLDKLLERVDSDYACVLVGASEFDHRIVNDDLNRASQELAELVATMSTP